MTASTDMDPLLDMEFKASTSNKGELMSEFETFSWSRISLNCSSLFKKRENKYLSISNKDGSRLSPCKRELCLVTKDLCFPTSDKDGSQLPP